MRTILLFYLALLPLLAAAQTEPRPANPIIKGFGTIYEIDEVTLRPDPTLNYRLIIDVVSGAEHPDSLRGGLNNVARMLNLFAVGGVPHDSLDVVLAIHGEATVGVMDDGSYRERFGGANPNAPLLTALKAAGVRITVCGQSLVGREIARDRIHPDVEVATSMLTTMAMYMERGYVPMRF